MTQSIPNARFWIYVNGGPVKITLKPGGKVELSEGGPCDEGYSRTWTKYRYAGGQVEQHWHTSSRDCDGRFEQGGVSVCHPYYLQSGAFDFETGGFRYPDWQHADSHQRDYAAEAAGY